MQTEPLTIRYIHKGEAKPRKPLPDVINLPTRTLAAACAEAGITVDDAISESCVRSLCAKRWHVMAILRSWGRSYTRIGAALNRDHTTVGHGLKRWAEMQEGK